MIAYTQNPPRNQRNQISELKSRCNQRGILVATHNPTPDEIIPLVERRLAEHQNHFAKNMDPFGGYHTEWKTIHDDLTKFLAEVRAAAGSANVPASISTTNAQNPPPSELPLPNQHSPGEFQVSSGELKVSSAESKPSSAEPEPSSAESQLTSNELLHTALQTADAQTNSTPASIEPYLQVAALEPFIDLARHLSGRSPLDHLTHQQQETILLLLADHSADRVAQMIAQPPPSGFGLKTTDASINRFRSRFIAAKCKAVREDNNEVLEGLLAQAQESDESFQNVIQRLIKDRLVRLAGQHPSAIEKLDCLLNTFIKLRKHHLAERQQAQAEKPNS